MRVDATGTPRVVLLRIAYLPAGGPPDGGPPIEHTLFHGRPRAAVLHLRRARPPWALDTQEPPMDRNALLHHPHRAADARQPARRAAPVAAQDAARRPTTASSASADLHALTTAARPGRLRDAIREMATLLLAAGSTGCDAVPAEPGAGARELAYLLECTAYTGELNRMIQFKEKGRGVAVDPGLAVHLSGADGGRHPAVPAAAVPVGDDQRQHVELTRDLAIRFNHTYGRSSWCPESTPPPAGARVMDLQRPDAEDGQVGADGAGRDPAARPARRRTPQGRARGHRLRHRARRGPRRPRTSRGSPTCSTSSRPAAGRPRASRRTAP